MNDPTPIARPATEGEESLLDAFLREALPEVKLALGDLIDRDNARAIPDRYMRMLPVTTLAVTLRPDAAEAVAPIAAELEAELTDSVMRHGSLFDREYRVRLRDAGEAGAPLFRAAVLPAAGAEAAVPAPSHPSEPPPAPSRAPERPARALERGAPEEVDPDATRVEGARTPAFPAGRFAVVVEGDEEGESRHPITTPVTTVGRETEDPTLRCDVRIRGSTRVSRRQLALVWAPRGDSAGFDVYNLGLNPVHLGEREIPGADRRGGALELGGLEGHRARVEPGEALRIGEHGPVVRIVDAGEDGAEEDPDRTRLG